MMFVSLFCKETSDGSQTTRKTEDEEEEEEELVSDSRSSALAAFLLESNRGSERISTDKVGSLFKKYNKWSVEVLLQFLQQP